MSHLISLNRLARLVGLPRSVLQRMAQSGDLATFDGQVEFAEVMRAFPNAKFANDSEIRRVEEIKDAALNKIVDRPDLPDAGVLMGRLQQLGGDFARLEARLRHQALVHGWLEVKLKALADEGELPRAASEELVQWFKRELETTSGDTERWVRLLTRERLMRVMSAGVTVLPRGLTFETQGNETLLEAGLRAGLSFAYGCSNGNCGDCKARVVQGEVVKVRPHDYALSEAQRTKGVTLMCSYAPVGDVVIEAAIAGTADIARQTITARVRSIDRLGSNVMGLNLLTPRSERLQFLAGQRVQVQFGDCLSECSIASCPCEERRIELHVGSSEPEAFASLARGELKPNDEIELVGPFGDFVLDEVSTRPLIFIAQGSGYAPIKSLLQHALSLDHAPSIALYWLAGPDGHYQDNLPRSYASALDNFSYIAVTRERPYDDVLGEIAARTEFAVSNVYAAGQNTFLELARSRLIMAGMPQHQWHAEVVDAGNTSQLVATTRPA